MRAKLPIVTLCTCLLEAFLLIGFGFCVCTLPQTTVALSKAYSGSNWIDHPPFSEEDLTTAALATRDYTIWPHDEVQLYQCLKTINDHARNTYKKDDFPGLPADAQTLDQLKEAAALTDESYVLSPEAISHLDDVNAVANAAFLALGLALVLFVGLMVYGSRKAGQAFIGRTLVFAGAGVVILFLLFGLWALADWNGIFAALHGVFFSQGNWMFSGRSLLITLYPTDFWVGMAMVWLISTMILSILSILVGILLNWRSKRHQITKD